MAALLSATVALAVLAPPASGATPTYPALFGSSEVRSPQIKRFKKWLGVIDRYRAEMPNELRSCRRAAAYRCRSLEWRAFLAEAAALPRHDQIVRVNAFVNELAYVIDPVNYGVQDYWATPLQFFARNGDCEDYAIAKYLSLRRLGFDDADLRIVVVQDLNLNIPHAVLAVYLDGTPLILDNQIEEVVVADRIRHYKAIYSINMSHWWIHHQ